MDAPADNCPECMRGPNRPTVVLLQGHGGVVCMYGCRACQHLWSCSWSADAVEAWSPRQEPGDAA
jgi:hypothetical protein